MLARQGRTITDRTPPLSVTLEASVTLSTDDADVTVGELEDGFYVEDDGTGFGLAIVHSIVDAHGWSISAEASASGGARFVVTDIETFSRRDGVPTTH